MKIRYRNQEQEYDRFFKIRNILNIIFIILAIIGILIYTQTDTHLVAYIIIGTGMLCKFVECVLRMLK